MANNCNKLMKEAFDNYLGIDMRYKLDDTLAALGKQKLNAAQLEGYLLKQGVSPKEIKQSGILENVRGDSRAFSGEDWLSMSGNQHLFKEEKMGIDTLYPDTTLNREGMQDTSKYTETISTLRSPKENAPYPFHFNPIEGESILGWRRTHVQDIDGKKTLVLNEIQSDWAQTERAGRGTFESSSKYNINSDEYTVLPGTYYDVQDLIEIENKKGNFKKAEDLELAIWIDEQEKERVKLKTLVDLLGEDWVKESLSAHTQSTKIADFPMAEIKHHQFQIVGAIDDALKQGIDTIAIPIQRENELAGSAGVTKFYENLNTKVLPDIRKKLETQGLRIKVDKKPYTGGTIDYSESFNRFINTELTREERMDLGYLQDLATNHLETRGVENETIFDAIESANTIDELLKALQPTSTNELWKLTVEEIPNKPVKWDVYGLIGALGLSSMLAGEANAEELNSSQVSISPKTNQQTQQQPQPIMEQMTTQPEVIEQPRQQMDEGFSLRKLLESDKLAPEVDEQSTASLFEQLGLVKKDELGNYRVNKDIDEDSRVDMRKQMPKTIQDQEGEYLTTHRPTKKSGWTIGRGYDSTGRKLQDIINDFAKAGISQQKAIAFFKHKPISINSKQSKALGDIAWQEKVKVAKSIGLPMEELDKEGFLKVMSLVYRGDIVKGGDGYRGRLYNYAKNGNIKAIDRFIKTEARNMEGGSVLYNRWKKFNKEI